MAKYIAFLIVGAIIGGATVLLTSSSNRSPSSGSDGAVMPAAGPAVDTPGSDPASARMSIAERFALEGNEVAALAARNPERALAQAMSKPGDSLKRILLIRAGEGAARRDPIAALTQAARIDNLELRSGFTLGIVNAWAELDPIGMLEYLETADPDDIRAPVPFDRLVIGDPEAVLERLGEYEGRIRQALERAALLALAETDAVGTLTRLDGMPPGPDKMQLTLAVAETYGRQDPNAALAWVASLSPPTQAALSGVVNGIATVDINQAIDWVLREVDSPTLAGLDPAVALPVTQIFQALRAGTIPMPTTAERLLASGDPTLKSGATTALMSWAPERPQEAVNFALDRLDQFDPDDLRMLAMATSESPGIGAQTADRLPPDYRATWVAGIADALVRTRPQRALDFLAGQRGRPGYDEGVVAIVRQLGPADPETAGMLVAESDPSPQIANAARILASVWTNEDERAARQWVIGLSSGEARDAAIAGALEATASAGEFDATLLDAMSSNASRQQAASVAILQIGRADQARARELLQTYITDQAQREQLEQQLAQLARSGAVGTNTPRLPTINFGQ